MRTSATKAKVLWSALLILIALRVSAQTDSSLTRTIDSTVVSARIRTSPIASTDKGLTVEIEGISKLPTILGSANPIAFIKLLPSAQTGSELDAGLHIQGCDHGHNLLSIDGVPVYGTNHLLGLFSIFNPAHFKDMDYRTGSVPGRLGGSLDMIPDRRIPDSVQADLSVGLISAQGTVRARAGQKTALSLSLRRTFLNQIYGRWLVLDEDPFKYGFHDVNIGVVSDVTENDRLSADFLYSADKAYCRFSDLGLVIDLGWSSAMGSLHWYRSKDGLRLKQDLFMTYSDSDADINSDFGVISIPSSIRNIGYRSSAAWKGWTAGADINYYDAMPQNAVSPSGSFLYDNRAERQRALETMVRAFWSCDEVSGWTAGAGIEGGWYLSPEKESFWSLNPSVYLKYNMYRLGQLALKAGASTQNLFLAGVTSLGFPIEFTIMAGKYGAPQRSLYSSLAYSLGLGHGEWSLDAEIYYRKLRNQLEFDSTVLDFFKTGNILENGLRHGDGWNYGLNMTLHKQAGALTGWVGYSLGRSLRRLEDGGVYPSNFERIHEFNVAATYSHRRWDVGGTLVAASGTPYTPMTQVYLTGGQLICSYGPRNSERLTPYFRMDLNFNWYFRKDGKATHGLNFSVYNVTARENQFFWKLKIKDGNFAYIPFSFAIKLLPGIGWFYKF